MESESSRIISLIKPRQTFAQNFTRIIASLISLTFLFPYLTWAFDASTFVDQPMNVLSAQSPLHLPASLGTVVHAFQGNTDKLVVHIQDLHCNYEVQANISRILHALAGKYQLKLVGIEGASLPINVTKLSTFPDEYVKRRAGDLFMRQGRMSGAEFYAAAGKHPIILEGVEDLRHYADNRVCVRSFLTDESSGYLFDLQEAFVLVKPKVYNSVLLAFDRQKTAYAQGKLSLLQFSAFLLKKCRQYHIPPDSYPQMQLYAASRKNDFPLEVDSDQLFHDLEQAENAVRQCLYASPLEREFDQLQQRLEIIAKLINASASPEELAAFRSNPGYFQTEVFVRFLSPYVAPETIDPGMYRLNTYLRKVNEFYYGADLRSYDFVLNLLEAMNKHQIRIAALATGGYHTEMVLQELQKQGISYFSIKPRITRLDQVNPYFSLLRQQHTPLEKLLAKNQEQIALEPLFMQWRDRYAVLDESQLPADVRVAYRIVDLTLKILWAEEMVARGVRGAEALKAEFEQAMARYRADNPEVRLDLANLRANGGFILIPIQGEQFFAAVYPFGRKAAMPQTSIYQLPLAQQEVAFYHNDDFAKVEHAMEKRGPRFLAATGEFLQSASVQIGNRLAGGRETLRAIWQGGVTIRQQALTALRGYARAGMTWLRGRGRNLLLLANRIQQQARSFVRDRLFSANNYLYFSAVKYFLRSLAAGMVSGVAYAMLNKPLLSLEPGWIGFIFGLLVLLLAFPRMYYFYRLVINPHADPLFEKDENGNPLTVEEQIGNLLESFKLEGFLPKQFAMPKFKLLTPSLKPAWLQFLTGVKMAEGARGTVFLHRNFPSLGRSMQKAYLLHEIHHAFGRGHRVSSFYEYRYFLILIFRDVLFRLGWMRPWKPSTLFFYQGVKESPQTLLTQLGGKGRNLFIMARMGIPVPPGFTIAAFESLNKKNLRRLSRKLWREIKLNVRQLEKTSGQRFGGVAQPLLVSVRSGADTSLPGIMTTVLNVGLNDTTVRALADNLQDELFAWETYAKFIEDFAVHVLGMPKEPFFAIRQAQTAVAGESGLRAKDYKALVASYKQYLKKEGKELPQNVYAQLSLAIQAVMHSWYSPLTRYERITRGIPNTGTGVTVQQMVFGNLNENSGTGVFFSRDLRTGQKGINGDFSWRQIGEALVSGSVTPDTQEALQQQAPELYQQAQEYVDMLERHNQSIQDVEITIENGKLYFLQTRNASEFVFPLAHLRSTMDMIAEGIISKKEALQIIPLAKLKWWKKYLLAPRMKKDVPNRLTSGNPAAPGIGSGQAVFNNITAKEFIRAKKPFILVKERSDVTDEPIIENQYCLGVLDKEGGLMSHAASLMRSDRRRDFRPCIVNIDDMDLHSGENEEYPHMFLGKERHLVRPGDYLILDGNTGNIFAGREAETEDSPAQRGANEEEGYGSAPEWKYLQEVDKWIAEKESSHRSQRYEAILDNINTYIANPNTTAALAPDVYDILSQIQALRPELLTPAHAIEIFDVVKLILFKELFPPYSRDFSKAIVNEEAQRFVEEIFNARALAAGKTSDAEILSHYHIVSLLLDIDNDAFKRLIAYPLGGHGKIVQALALMAEDNPEKYVHVLNMWMAYTPGMKENEYNNYIKTQFCLLTRSLSMLKPETLTAVLMKTQPQVFATFVFEWLARPVMPLMEFIFYPVQKGIFPDHLRTLLRDLLKVHPRADEIMELLKRDAGSPRHDHTWNRKNETRQSRVGNPDWVRQTLEKEHILPTAATDKAISVSVPRIVLLTLGAVLIGAVLYFAV
ncbi:hypothetical protein JW933_04020, partial [candidate division FCPU426 bacterium]|nr:hypothetical protein [candidate division FCPU426 bacterium]